MPYKGGKQEDKSSSLPFIRAGLGWGKTFANDLELLLYSFQ
ncbi:hypothetical protein GXM_06540 [Nostoc sphaeroides CCNUC1]|uniref:Uncharacterized protein n=1 Tax=Nostoc sphaeroides CCNUC1 TaxID=2653204 RepID=A0A5P8WA38_9NOSO|nr:hypothetical protein GXM_06540 [Nostoc sphaeroides CCNUC1]